MGRQTRPVPAMSPDEQRAMVAGARVARLATLRPDGTARLVPITFVLLDGLVCSAVDEVKPKRSPRLARLDDVRRDPRAAVLVDRYSDDWAQLWWVRIDGMASAHETGDLAERTRAALADKYVPYATTPPQGPVLVLTPTRWTGWSAS
jgi:PPOX class probable F420-dependent enzyme